MVFSTRAKERTSEQYIRWCEEILTTFPHNPESDKELFREVIMRAYYDSRSSSEDLQNEAMEWIVDGRCGIVSFNWACEALGVDADIIREALCKGSGLPREEIS